MTNQEENWFHSDIHIVSRDIVPQHAKFRYGCSTGYIWKTLRTDFGPVLAWYLKIFLGN